MNIQDAWIKASVENVSLEIEYYSGRTKQEYTKREVEPDFYGLGNNGKNHGLWGINYEDRGIRCFKEDSVIDWRVIGNNYTHENSRSSELLNEYYERGLDKTKWPKEKQSNDQC